jgi:signal transduction histidine kinase
LSRISRSNIRVVLGAWRGETFVEAVAATRDGSVWAGTAEGLHRRVGDRVQTYGTADGLPAPVVTSLHEDSEGTLWAATSDGVARFENGHFVAIAESSGAGLRGVQSMATDLSGALWLCDTQGLFKWEHSQLTRIVEAKREGRPYVVYADSLGRVWVGFWIGGIVMFDHGQVTSFGRDAGLPDGTVNIVYEDSRGIIWAGTSKGLLRFEGGRFVPLARNGFLEEAVVSMIEDDRHNLWVGLASGLVRIEHEEVERLAGNGEVALYYRAFGTEDGLPGTLGRPGMPSSTLDESGRLWFVTSVGLVVIDPNHLTATPTRGPLRIEQLVADGRPYALSSHLQLPAGTSRIQIDYSILSLAAGGRPRFRYRLNSFDADWQDAGERRQASYTNLPPGDYSFQVASNETEGDGSRIGATFAFSIQPAFYQTGSFYAACVFLLLLGVWSAWRLRLRRVHRQFELVLAERVRMGREIHDTLLQSLVGVALEFDDISEQLDPSAQSLGTQVRRIRQQVEYYIREARQSIWNLRSPICQSGDLPSALRHFGETVTAGHFGHFEFTVSGNPRRGGGRTDEQLLRIGQEALMNAVRHSGATTITAELRYSSDTVCLAISDDGCGFEQNEMDDNEGVHWGVTSMRERAEQIGATFRLTSGPGAGTTIETSVPLPRE